MAFSSFYSGLSGLQANSAQLSVIGNNLANMNTVGYKASRMTFGDVFTQAGGGVNGAGHPQQIGLGVQVGSIDSLFAQGSLQTTGLVTDLAIQGNGLFVLADGSGARSYTRAGNFTFDKDGNLVTPGGVFVQGYTEKDATGNITAAGAIGNVKLAAGQSAPPRATTSFNSVINLSADADVDDPTTAGLNEADTFSTTLTVYDSLGSRHNVTVNFTPVDTDADGKLDQWDYAVTAPGDEVAGGTTGTPFPLSTGTLTFDSKGQLTGTAGTVTVNVPGWSNGAAAQPITWNLLDRQGASLITGFSGPSATSATNQDGYASGLLQSITIDQNGLVSGVFTNGASLQLARIALAVFGNQNGLMRTGQNNFIETNGSGPAAIGSANTGGRGITTANALELSNVDVTQEFTNLIISERGYQANSRIITTTDQIMQEALNLKR